MENDGIQSITAQTETSINGVSGGQNLFKLTSNRVELKAGDFGVASGRGGNRKNNEI